MGAGRSTDRPATRAFGGRATTLEQVYSDGYFDPADDQDPVGPWPAEASEPRQLTLAMLEDLATVLAEHGFPPLRGYALAELAASLYRISRL